MAKITKLLLVFLLVVCGCSNSLYRDAETVDLVYKATLQHNDLIIEDGSDETESAHKSIKFTSAKTNSEFKGWILDAVKRREVILRKGLLKRIVIVGDLFYNPGNPEDTYTLDGFCYGDEIWIASNNRPKSLIKMTLDHELGHILESSLSDEQWDEWTSLYEKKLKEVGLDGPLGDSYRKATEKQVSLFPTSYALKNVREYFAVLYEHYCFLPEITYENLYPREFALIKKHGLPR